jgi:GPH family glycoside/pentoside/hexuronide:cation symporter
LISKLAVAFAGFAIATFLAWGGYVPTMEVASPTLSYWLRFGFLGMPTIAILIEFLLVLASRRDPAA